MNAVRAYTVLPPIRTAIALCLLATLSGCYYAQAVRGHIGVMSSREPIADLMADPETTEELRTRLELVVDARAFAVSELGLPDNDSYLSYADLEREYVVWSVFAAPEFSLAPRQWCFPVVGCVAYRGYFREAAARREAERLAAKGYDTHVGGVVAYSTLGRFEDPLLNTMLRWDDVQLVTVLFHELAHQRLYVKDDTAFNEAFATAVEEIGIERFLESRGMPDLYAAYTERKALRREIMALVEAARGDLRRYYSETIDDDEKRLLKEHRIEQLEHALRRVLVDAGRNADAFLAAPMNNARLISMALYEARLPAFRQLLNDCGGELDCFYTEADKLAALDHEARAAWFDAR